MQRATITSSVIPGSFLVALMSQFDTFLGRIIRAIYLINPRVFSISEKSVTYSKLMEFESISDAHEYIIEREVDIVLRDSHEEQFKYLEDRVNVNMREQLRAWPDFVEVTERRNLFVHTDGAL